MPITKNKKAYFDYEIIDTWEAWVELKWHEVKSIRENQVNLKGSYIILRDNEAYVKGMHISAWKALPNRTHIETERERKIMLPKKLLVQLWVKIKESWVSLIPLELYFKWSLIKLKVWLARWRKAYQKKQVLKERTMEKEAKKLMNKYY